MTWGAVNQHVGVVCTNAFKSRFSGKSTHGEVKCLQIGAINVGLGVLCLENPGTHGYAQHLEVGILSGHSLSDPTRFLSAKDYGAHSHTQTNKERGRSKLTRSTEAKTVSSFQSRMNLQALQ